MDQIRLLLREQSDLSTLFDQEASKTFHQTTILPKQKARVVIGALRVIKITQGQGQYLLPFHAYLRAGSRTL